jgi:tetratricopeptide (TPR) repeat protein
MMRLVPLLALLPLAGCAYFNGIYNARQAERKGDALRRSGRTAEAESVYAIAAAKAESVLVRYPHSRWRGDALFIAGWSWAMASRCSRAEPHLEAFLTRGEVTETALARATLALAACRVQEGEAAQGRALVAPLVHSPDRHLANEAAVWAALASARLGELDSTQAYLRQVAGRPARARAAWMVVGALLKRGDLPAAESILVQRAAQGDYQHDLLRTLRALWNAGGAERVARIVERYDSSRISSDDRARLHLLMGELALAAGRDSTARVHLMIARSLARDTVVLQDASAGLTQAELASLTSLVDVANVVARGHERGGGEPHPAAAGGQRAAPADARCPRGRHRRLALPRGGGGPRQSARPGPRSNTVRAGSRAATLPAFHQSAPRGRAVGSRSGVRIRRPT